LLGWAEPLLGSSTLLLGRARLARPLRLLCRARLARPPRLLRRARRFRLLASRLGRSSGQALTARRSGRGSWLTSWLDLTRESWRVIAEPALLAGSQRRRRNARRRRGDRPVYPLPPGTPAGGTGSIGPAFRPSG
jgi:hypothetical protein